MIDRLLLVSTCGTSLLTNRASAEDQLWLKKIANEVKVDEDRLNPIVSARRRELVEGDEGVRRGLSAELNGIGAVLERYQPRRILHQLVHTDTVLGRSTAELVQATLTDTLPLISAGGLRTSDLGSFRAALSDLTKQLAQLVESYRADGWFVVFNLTGGFKSLNGYLQTLAMISADRCVFLFEGASDLMEIPRLPVRLAEIEELRQHAEIFRRLAVGYPVASEAARGVPESLLMEVGGEVTSSQLGDVVWERHRRTLLAERLQPPLSAKVRVGDAVRKAFDGLQEAQRVAVNEALDEFSAYLDWQRPLLKSRTFKKLRGATVPGSSHELYAWSDGSAGRLFGHYDTDGSFVFDQLGDHL